MTDEEEVSETFTLTQRPTRITVAELPRSPKSVFLAAEACGWEARAWVSSGRVAPTLYVSNSKSNASDKGQHNAGDVKTAGYTLRMFTVEARDLKMPLGFRARFLGKEYEGRKPTAGSFEDAHIVDPVGIPTKPHVEYKAIRQVRAKYETGQSFERRSKEATERASQMSADYNDGEIFYFNETHFSVARDFDSWLSEWRSFAQPTTKKVKINA